MIFKFIIKLRAKRYGYPIMKVSKDAFEEYKEVASVEEHKDTFLMLRKISRNWYVGNVVRVYGNFVERAYGNMNILFDFTTQEIVKVTNHKGFNRGNRINYVEKQLIDDLYCLAYTNRNGGVYNDKSK